MKTYEIKNRFPIVALDFDDTIVVGRYPAIGDFRPNSVEVIKRLYEWCEIIIWTCRVEKELDLMKQFLIENDVPFDRINENSPYINFAPWPKIYYDVCVDDRNLGGTLDWLNVEKEIKLLFNYNSNEQHSAKGVLC